MTYPVIPTIRNEKDVKTALDNLRAYFHSLLLADQAVQSQQADSTIYTQITGIDLSTADFILAGRTTIEILEVTTGSNVYSIIAPNTPNKRFIVSNNDSLRSVTIKVDGGVGVVIPPASRRQVYCTGLDYEFTVIPDTPSSSMSVVMSFGDEGGVEEPFPFPPGGQGRQGERGTMGPPGTDGEDGEDRYIVINTENKPGRWQYAAVLADTSEITLPTITVNWSAHGFIHCAHASAGTISDSADFEYGSDGTVRLISGTANIEANGATAGKISIGAAISANPVVIKNNLGGGTSVNAMIVLWYN